MRKTVGCAALSCALSLAGAKAVKWLDNNPRWEPPAQTQLDYLPELGRVSAMGTPAPTPAPKPSKARGVLEVRDSTDNTCGYVEGEFTRSLWCGATTSHCVYNSRHSHLGCCNDKTTSSCFVPTTCYDSTESASYSTDNGFTLWCGNEEYPHCKKYTYEDAVFTGYTLYGCAVAAGTSPIYYEAFDGPTTTGGRRSSTSTPPRITDDPTSSTRGGAGSSTGRSGSSTGSSDRTSASSTTSTSTATPIPDPAPASSTPTGPIVGGVVGGVGAVALIILGIWALMRQNDKQKKKAAEADAAAAAAVGAAHQQQQHPPPGPPGPPNMAYAQPPPPDPGMTKIDPNQHGGYYNPSVVGGFDPRASIAPTTISPPQSPPPQSPPPPHHSTPSPPPPNQQGFAQQQQQQQGYAAYGNVNPSNPGEQQQQYGNVSPSGTTISGNMGYQPYHPGAQQQHPGQQQGYPANVHELPVHRGDGELRELQG
ncbi:hypothetical protein N657DRAFT_641906 [Parathielavia appendiculata]|uniref:Uncharacterized protein n=1 Tax=Parathielavia appendiculata TaxID=2587402 RepID=A0AAN6U8J6_9PEZI|nr:hypothetical protein N657DRAFT_641906 [Parathielavia appendiculata]